jgi:NADH-quinone oxidoreductase subunit F
MFAVSGHVRRPGVYEVPNGSTTFRDLIYGDDYSQGISGENTLKAFVPGGGSAPWFIEDQLDLPFEGRLVGAAGSMLGTGGVIVTDDTTDIPMAGSRSPASTPMSRAASARPAVRVARG